jgi:hypothetical protein
VPLILRSARSHPSTSGMNGVISNGCVPARDGPSGGTDTASSARYLRTVRQSQPHSRPISANVAPAMCKARKRRMFIQDSVSRIMSRVALRVCLLGGGQPKGDPSLGAEESQRAETDLHVRSYGERHMRSYADTRELFAAEPETTDPPRKSRTVNRTPQPRCRHPEVLNLITHRRGLWQCAASLARPYRFAARANIPAARVPVTKPPSGSCSSAWKRPWVRTGSRRSGASAALREPQRRLALLTAATRLATAVGLSLDVPPTPGAFWSVVFSRHARALATSR